MTPLAAIAELLRVRIGLDAGALGARALGLAVRRRARARGIDGLDAYRTVLAGDANEWQALIEAVVVPESWFFRDVEPFALLARWAPGARRPGTRLTLLSLPCAGGEEPWSMAIALAAAGMPPESFHIDAVDLSERALAVARQGIYPQRALRAKPLPDEWRAYLRPLPERRFEVDPALRGSLRFAVGNLVDAPRTLRARHYDAIFSRNLLIYCDATTRAAALTSFAAALRADGLLVLGHADPMPPGTPGFVRTGPPAAFAWRRAAAPLRPPAPRQAAPPAAPRRAAHRRAQPTDPLQLARQLADRGRLPEAAALATAQLASAPVDLEALTLLGVVRAAQGRDDEAAQHLRRVLSLAPQHEEALLHLALVLERAGDQVGAARLRARAKSSHR